jgi:hypothetical protein
MEDPILLMVPSPERVKWPLLEFGDPTAARVAMEEGSRGRYQGEAGSWWSHLTHCLEPSPAEAAQWQSS